MISHALLLRVLRYDTETGVFVWLVDRGRARAGERAGFEHSNGYTYIGFEGKEYLVHRLAWFYVTGTWPTTEVDHRNRTRSDNRFANLREATHSQNGSNRPAQSNGTSGLKGVSFHRRAGKWRATIQKKYLGLFDSKQAAHAAYRRAAQDVFGEYARV